MAATLVGVWVGSQFWPHWVEYRDRQPPKPDAPSLTQPAIVPAAAPDAGTSLLGTDASTSEKPLQLVLVATSLGRTLQESTASLGTDPRNPQTYAGGATLANGALIEEIQADRVVLRLGRQRATLMINHDVSARSALNDELSGERAEARHPYPISANDDGKSLATSIGGLRRGMKHQEEVRASHETLSEFVRSQPVFENERLVGLQLLPGTKASRLESLGVQPGDVIRSVGGKLIESDTAWQSIDDALSSGNSIVVGIERNGSLTSVLLNGANLGKAVSTNSPPPQT